MSRNRLRSITHRLESIQPPRVPIFLAPAGDGFWTLVGRSERFETEDAAVAAAHSSVAPARAQVLVVRFVNRRAARGDPPPNALARLIISSHHVRAREGRPDEQDVPFTAPEAASRPRARGATHANVILE